MSNSELKNIQKEYETEAKKQEISVAIDIVIFTIQNETLKILLNKRTTEPHKNKLALPGGFCLKDISLEDNAKQLLKRDVNIENVYLEQLYTFGNLKRDVRGRTISISYYALVDFEKLNIQTSQKFDETKWIPFNDINLYKLAFDHKEIIKYAHQRIQNKIEYEPLAYQLLSQKFTLAELQKVYEIILNKKIDKRNFRKKLMELNIVKELDETKQIGRMRPAKLYKFISKK